MRSLAWAFLIGASLTATSGREPDRRIVDVHDMTELYACLVAHKNDVTIRLAPGRYEFIEAKPFDLPSFGLKVSGRNILIVGAGPEEVVLSSPAEYTVRFDDCADCAVDHVRVAGNIDVGGGSVRISNCIVDNGIQAVRGDFIIECNEISSSSDGIDLANAQAVVKNNVIIGTRNEHGAGVLVRGEATVSVERNHVRGFSAGIALARRASVDCNANIIEEIGGIGIDGAEGGLGRIAIRDNVIYQCKSSGIVIRADGDQLATRNLVVETGTLSPRESAVLALGAQADAAVRRNTLYDNTVKDSSLDRDVSREVFWRARRPWTRTYRNTPVGVDGRHKFYESAFLTRYGRWAN